MKPRARLWVQVPGIGLEASGTGQRPGAHVPHRGAGTSAARRDEIPLALRMSRARDGGDAEDCVREGGEGGRGGRSGNCSR